MTETITPKSTEQPAAPSPEEQLQHRVSCLSEPRLERTQYPELGLFSARCIECGVHAAFESATGERLPEPDGFGPWAGSSARRARQNDDLARVPQEAR